mgnify:FL=1
METTIINILGFKDQTGRLITMGNNVSVDEPRDTIIDGYDYGFMGTVQGFRGPCIVVSDPEGDTFEVEPFKVKVED